MVLLLLIGITLTGVAVAMTARALAVGTIRRNETFAQIEAYGFSRTQQTPAEDVDGHRLRDVLDRLAFSIGRAVLPRLGAAREDEIRALLRAAGSYQTQAETFVGYRMLAAVVLPVFLLWLQISSGSFGLRTALLVTMVGVMGWVLPSFFLKRRGSRRIEAIDLETPELVDLLVTTVEAGLSFAAALHLVARRVEGPLGQELRIALQEHAMGLSLEEALENMLARVDSTSVRSFVQAVVQGQSLGVSIGKILRELAVEMRKRRRQMAEERAHKAPTKILFPLVFLILPALFIIVLGGPVMGLGQTLGSQL